ncbi:M13 family metallopeptidase [Litorimonas haliclonae]|uniref:M13 family metallopeptidase n=1 Tax=Litorimonas haliclonae TaxID=2081977 RepID=UPI0039F08A7F
MKSLKLIIPSLMVIGLVACGGNSDEPEVTDTQTEVTETVPAKPKLGEFGIAMEYVDETVDPGDNFFQYVNGKWLDQTEIPADRSSYGSFNVLRDESQADVREIIEEAAAKDAAPGSDEQKIGDFYAAFMDTDSIEAAGLEPIQADIDRIMAVDSKDGVATLMGDPSLGIRAPMVPYVGVDLKNPTAYIVYMTQSGLGLPNRDYYFDEGEKSDAIRAGYIDYLTTLMTELGKENPEERAQNVFEFEKTLAEPQWKPEKRRDRSLTYNKMTLEELKAYAEGFPFDPMLDAASLTGQTEFVIREKDAFKGMAEAFAEADLDVLKDYMAAGYVSGKSAYLPKRIDDANFAFYGTTLSGTPEQQARWKRAVDQIDRRMGEIVGKVYVEKHFPEESKAKMDDLIENLRAAFKEGITNLEWMGEETKVEAQDKLAKFNPKIGYPDKWTDYGTLEVDRNDLIGTVKSASAWDWKKDIDKLGGPIDRDEWGMNPQTVNAYYNASLNEIVFPAAILQAPFFDPNADAAVNYGGIGAVIGHEMGHGFDDQGRKTDGTGLQRDWWTEEDGKAFSERSDALVAQYAAFEPLPGENINGKLTLGENIGDLTGVQMAYNAYKRSLNGEEAPVIDGLTGDQRFFLAWAQIWQIKFRDEALSNRLKTDPHSPGEYRANGIVRNFDAWYEAFNVTPENDLYLPPEERVKIW